MRKILIAAGVMAAFVGSAAAQDRPPQPQPAQQPQRPATVVDMQLQDYQAINQTLGALLNQREAEIERLHKGAAEAEVKKSEAEPPK